MGWAPRSWLSPPHGCRLMDDGTTTSMPCNVAGIGPLSRATLSVSPDSDPACGLVGRLTVQQPQHAARLDGELEREAEFGVVEVVAEQFAGAGQTIEQRVAVKAQPPGRL